MSETHHIMSLNDMYIFDTPDSNIKMTILASNPNMKAVIQNRIRHSFLSQLKKTIIHTKSGVYVYSGKELSKKPNSVDATKTMIFCQRTNRKNFLYVVV